MEVNKSEVTDGARTSTEKNDSQLGWCPRFPTDDAHAYCARALEFSVLAKIPVVLTIYLRLFQILLLLDRWRFNLYVSPLVVNVCRHPIVRPLAPRYPLLCVYLRRSEPSRRPAKSLHYKGLYEKTLGGAAGCKRRSSSESAPMG